ncbi:MAG: putative lipid II flippase FtsW [Oscillospiraceae bacterium]|nr:putative lipid II flippase FtsW [Oscillospiraceae bacterium]
MDYKSDRLADYTDDSGIGRGSIDIPFLLLVMLLLTIGVITVLSASYARAYYSSETGYTATYYFTRQLTFAGMGVAAMLVASRFPIGFYRRFAAPIYIFAVVLLLLVLVAGENVNGSKRWFTIGGITFQPSEIAKIAVILIEAELVCRFKSKMSTFRYGVVPFVAIAGIIIGLLIFEPHFSASIIIVSITAILMFAGGTRLFWFIAGGAAVGGLGALVLLGTGYTSDRITAWLDPFADSSDTGYQIIQSLYAIGSGGLTGLGFGESRQKYLYLPEEHNDYIFAIFCEEMGFVGAMLVLLLFALLIVRGYWLAIHCRDRYSFLVCTGITSLLALQVILNVAVVTNLLPATGISLPFFSYGGTALLIQLAEMGIVLSISRDIPEKKSVKPRKNGAEITQLRANEETTA